MYNYKTILCKQWSYNGKCSYYHKCMFAHGTEELMQPGEYDLKKRRRARTRIRKQSITQSVFSRPKDDDADYTLYWSMIHDMIIQESENKQQYHQHHQQCQQPFFYCLSCHTY
jgi:hypothetical protein